jgi:hypothetical protein
MHDSTLVSICGQDLQGWLRGRLEVVSTISQKWTNRKTPDCDLPMLMEQLDQHRRSQNHFNKGRPEDQCLSPLPKVQSMHKYANVCTPASNLRLMQMQCRNVPCHQPTPNYAFVLALSVLVGTGSAVAVMTLFFGAGVPLTVPRRLTDLRAFFSRFSLFSASLLAFSGILGCSSV